MRIEFIKCPCGTANDYIHFGMGNPFVWCIGCGVKKNNKELWRWIE